jgi:hypothetical protein
LYKIKRDTQYIDFGRIGVGTNSIRTFERIISIASILMSNEMRRIKWAWYVARMGERIGVYTVWWGNLKEKTHLGDPCADGRITLRWIFRKWILGVWIGSRWLMIGRGGAIL